MLFGGQLIDLPLGIDGPDAVGAWVEVYGGGGMVGTDIASMATSPVEPRGGGRICVKNRQIIGDLLVFIVRIAAFHALFFVWSRFDIAVNVLD